MKNISLITLLICLCSNLVFAQSTDNAAVIRLNGIYVDEVTDGGDEGIGATVEFAIILDQTEDIFQTLGFEVGYITSEAEEVGIELDTDIVPFLVNYTMGGNNEGPGFAWEAGVGVGVYLVDAELNIDLFGDGSDDDVIFGGQVFGSLGYKFTKSSSLLAGVRYMLAEDAKLFGLEDEVLNSVAFDLSLNFAF